MSNLTDKIIQSIRDIGPSTTAEIASHLGERRRTVSQHLYSDPRARLENSRWIVTDGAYTANLDPTDTQPALIDIPELTHDHDDVTDEGEPIPLDEILEPDTPIDQGPGRIEVPTEDIDAESPPTEMAESPQAEEPVLETDGGNLDGGSIDENETDESGTNAEETQIDPMRASDLGPLTAEPEGEKTEASRAEGLGNEETVEFEEEEASKVVIEGVLSEHSGRISAAPKEQLKSTLDYLVAINERDKKVVRDFRKYDFSITDSELLPLEGVETPRAADSLEDWFRIPRLQKTNPPTPLDDLVKPWLNISKSPQTEPKRREAITVEVDGEEQEIFWDADADGRLGTMKWRRERDSNPRRF